MIVAIDGPSGVGKSTVAKLIAARLGYAYLDSGALYRAVAWKALSTGTDPAASDAIRRLSATTTLKVSSTVGGGMVVEVDGQALQDELRTPEVSRAASQGAALPEVRAWLLPVQQSFGRQAGVRGLVAEGRDMGTRVFPQAPVKFFLEASPTERARRRYAEFVGAGQAAELEETPRELEARDGRDRTRESATPTAGPGAVNIETGRLMDEGIIPSMVCLIARKT